MHSESQRYIGLRKTCCDSELAEALSHRYRGSLS